MDSSDRRTLLAISAGVGVVDGAIAAGIACLVGAAGGTVATVGGVVAGVAFVTTVGALAMCRAAAIADGMYEMQ